MSDNFSSPHGDSRWGRGKWLEVTVEQLYQAREGTKEYEKWTKNIKHTVSEIEKTLEKAEPPQTIDQKEINNAIKKLKRKKSTGPDNIPNEIFIEANKETREIYREALNTITQTEEIPDEWQEGNIITMYKGKGMKGKCSNERGITLSSNFGKLYERIINERAKKDISITDAQAGGKKGSATVDHLLILRELENIAKKQNKRTYMAFLDVTKAYDKAWSEAIMYVMHKQGIKDKHWRIIKKLNENLTAKIATKYGETRKIKIKDSIRQGGVLSVLEYGVLMDEINKDIQKEPIGIEIEENNTRIACLLWVDDVVLISTSQEELQKMLDITNQTTKKYHIEFGKAKSNIMKRGGQNTKEPAKLGDMELEVTDKYKYLGQIMNNKGNLKDHIKMTKGKVEAAYQKILTTAGNATFHYIEMEVMWKTLETNILPILTYSGEVWKATKKEEEEINRIYDNIIKRILKTPQSTPRECLYIETGLLDPITITKRNRLNMHNRITNGNNQTLKALLQRTDPSSWAEENRTHAERIGLDENALTTKKQISKREITNKIKVAFKEEIEGKGRDKSKVKFLLEGKNKWDPGHQPEYMKTLTRNEVSTIFKARTRMLDVKANYKNKYQDLQCRLCGKEDETQEHVLAKCEKTKQTKHQVPTEDIFTEDPEKLRKTAAEIEVILNTINNPPPPTQKNHQGKQP